MKLLPTDSSEVPLQHLLVNTLLDTYWMYLVSEIRVGLDDFLRYASLQKLWIRDEP